MPGKKKNNRNRPVNPDPARYEWVNSSEGGYYRLKKAAGTPVNSSLRANNNATESLAPAIKRIRMKLDAYTQGLDPGRVQGKMSGLLSGPFKKTGLPDLAALKGFEFQKEHVLEKLLLVPYRVTVYHNHVELLIPVAKGTVKKHNNLVTDFYFEGILLHGDAMQEGSLAVEYAVSAPYSFSSAVKQTCKLELPLPRQVSSWMLLLKVSCLEGNEMAAHARHYGMKVVEVGVTSG